MVIDKRMTLYYSTSDLMKGEQNMGVKNTDDNRNTKKPFVYYYLIVLLVVFLLNAFLFPSMMERTVMEVGYNQFLDLVDQGAVDVV